MMIEAFQKKLEKFKLKKFDGDILTIEGTEVMRLITDQQGESILKPL